MVELKKTTIGGFLMPRSYRHISDYEKEIIEKFNSGESLKSIAENMGFSYKQIKNFKYRYNCSQRKINSGQAIHKKGRPPKDYEITEDMKINELKYIIARKDSKIKRLEMENELMRDFLSHTERK